MDDNKEEGRKQAQGKSRLQEMADISNELTDGFDFTPDDMKQTK